MVVKTFDGTYSLMKMPISSAIFSSWGMKDYILAPVCTHGACKNI